MTRRLRTVTKIFKNMYLSGRTAVQFQFQSRTLAGAETTAPHAAPSFALTPLPRCIYFAFPSCRETGLAEPLEGCCPLPLRALFHRALLPSRLSRPPRNGATIVQLMRDKVLLARVPGEVLSAA